MKRTMLVVLGAMLLLAARTDAARRIHVADPIAPATIDLLADGTELLIIEHESRLSLHWSPARGFHYGRTCCRRAGAGRSARVSAQRFAGIDAAAGRPMYVRGRF